MQRPVFDSDLSVNGDKLKEIAIQYATEYCGNFHYMIDAQRLAIDTHDLPDGIVRGVLNCLRRDPIQVGRWQEVQSILHHPSQESRTRKPKLRVVTEPSRYRILKTPVVIRARFATTVSKASNPVLHWIDSVVLEEHNAYCEWKFPYDWDDFMVNYNLGRQPSLAVPIFCRPNPRSNVGRLRLHLERPTWGDAWAGHRGNDTPLPDCRTCLRRIEADFLGDDDA